jgi:hypothetical protein
MSVFDELLACVIRSSHAMDETVKALAFDPLHAHQIILLNDSLKLTRVILTKVLIHPASYSRFLHLRILDGRQVN